MLHSKSIIYVYTRRFVEPGIMQMLAYLVGVFMSFKNMPFIFALIDPWCFVGYVLTYAGVEGVGFLILSVVVGVTYKKEFEKASL